MSLLSKLSDFVAGGLFREIKETAMAYLPPDLSPAQKAEFELRMQEHLHQKELAANKALAESEQALNERIREQEGTAKELAQFGIVGKSLVFLRGAQRPLWGFFVMYLDYEVFIRGSWPAGIASGSDMGLDLQSAFWVINFLVLGFLFGERAIRNAAPLLAQLKGRRQK